jgi:hypothetical protein
MLENTMSATSIPPRPGPDEPVGLRFLPYIFWGLTGLLFLLALLWAPVNKDAGYFLSTARAMAEGDAPFRDVALRYPPMAMLAFAAFGKTFGFERYEALVLLVLLVQSANAWLLYRLAGRLWPQPIFQGLTAVAYMLAFLLNDGPFIMLEPFLVLGALSATFFVFKGEEPDGNGLWYLLAGIAAGFSVMSKQYGLAPVGVLGFYVLFLSGRPFLQRLLSVGWMAFGGAVFGGFFFGTFWLWSGIGPADLLGKLLSAGEDYGYHRIDWALKFVVKHVLWCCPTVLLALLVPRAIAGQGRGMGLLLSVYASMLPLYFKQYPHYTQIYLPYAFLLAHWALGTLAAQRPQWFAVARWSFVALCAWLAVQGFLLANDWRAGGEKYKLRELADRARALVPNDEKCLLYGKQHLYYMADLQPADKSRHGFRFRPPWQVDTTILEQVSLVLVDRSKNDQKPVPPGENVLLQAGFQRLEDSPGFPELEWWTRNPIDHQ